MARIASVDVFDTVLTRTLGGPREVFVESGRQLRRAGVVTVDPPVYALAREEAVRDLTTDIGRHPTLAAIAAEVTSRLGLPAEAARTVAATELAVEAETCRAVPGAAARLADLRTDTRHGVVFISDTSMPAEPLTALLTREGLFVAGDRLFTSSAVGASKQEGGLFDVVAAELGVAGDALHHIGDSRSSDLAHARLHGWNAELDTRAHLNGHERRLDREGTATDGLAPRLAGASRLGRLAAGADGVDVSLAAVAGGVALPLLAGFGLWVLRQAQLLELDRLYFVARDGEVFLEVTQRLAEHAGAGVECRYLYGSRRSWQLAAYGSDGAAAGPWIPDDVPPESLTARAVLALVDLTPADALAVVDLPAAQDGAADEPLGEAGWAALAAHLTAGPLATAADARAAARRDLLLRYLDQEGVTAPGRVGLVDVGWTGRAARALEDVMLAGHRPLPAAHLFLGLTGSAPDRMGADLYARSRGWLLDEARGRPARSGEVDPVMFVESFAMGREGHTVGYVDDGGTVVPELSSAANPAAARWGFEDYRRALALALDALLDGPPPDAGIDLRALVWHQLMSFWRAPGPAEAAAWGAQPYGEDFANARTHPLATAVTARRMLTRLGIGRPEWREPTYWLAGTIAVSPQPWQSLLRSADRAQRLTARLPRLPTRLRTEWAMRRA